MPTQTQIIQGPSKKSEHETAHSYIRHLCEIAQAKQEEVEDSPENLEGHWSLKRGPHKGSYFLSFRSSDRGKKRTAFDRIFGPKLKGDFKPVILQYFFDLIEESGLPKDCKLSDVEVALYYGDCSSQSPHIDVAPGRVVALTLTDNCPGTQYLEPKSKPTFSDWYGILKAMESQSCIDEDEMPLGLLSKIHSNVEAMEYFHRSGVAKWVVNEKDTLEEMQSGGHHDAGTLISLPGDALHAAPSSTGFRALIFATYHRSDIDLASYDPDEQYTGTAFMFSLVGCMWNSIGIGVPERLYLLRRLVQYIKGSLLNTRDRLNLGGGRLADFVGNIAASKLPHKFNTENDYIMHLAQSDDLGFERRRLPEFGLGELTCISCDDLYASLGQKSYNVAVYRRESDKAIILRYNLLGNDFYEGYRDGEEFQLSMNKPNEIFDGFNGKLLDWNGKEVVFVPRRASKRQRQSSG